LLQPQKKTTGNPVGFQARGFYTVEIRSGRTRMGFKIVSLGGKEEVLAHVDFCSK